MLNPGLATAGSAAGPTARAPRNQPRPGTRIHAQPIPYLRPPRRVHSPQEHLPNPARIRAGEKRDRPRPIHPNSPNGNLAQLVEQRTLNP